MKQNDFLLIISVIIIVFILLILNFNSSSPTLAKVYYESELILTIDMSKNGEYDVQGYNGNVHIVVEDYKIKVEEENSPKNLCSKQGFISSSNEMIVCLPNKILIQIESDDSLDVVIG